MTAEQKESLTQTIWLALDMCGCTSMAVRQWCYDHDLEHERADVQAAWHEACTTYGDNVPRE